VGVIPKEKSVGEQKQRGKKAGKKTKVGEERDTNPPLHDQGSSSVGDCSRKRLTRAGKQSGGNEKKGIGRVVRGGGGKMRGNGKKGGRSGKTRCCDIK